VLLTEEKRGDLKDVESAICQLRDVISARVIAGATGVIEEIHVLTQSSRPPKQIVRDIESALMAQMGIHIDHKTVSVAQVQGPQKQERRRLRFSDVSISVNGNKAEATVHLANNGTMYTGAANGHSSAHSQLRLIATASLRAVEDAGAVDGTMVVEDLSASTSIAGKNVVVVVTNMITDRGEDLLSGSCIVKQDLWKAVVNATLDAVNRRMSVASVEE
jgi:predicted nucleic-acid-binding protein